MAFQRRDDDEIRARLVRIREIGLEVVCVAFRAGLVVSEFDVEVVPGLQETALAVGVRARGKSALALIADRKICRLRMERFAGAQRESPEPTPE